MTRVLRVLQAAATTQAQAQAQASQQALHEQHSSEMQHATASAQALEGLRQHCAHLQSALHSTQEQLQSAQQQAAEATHAAQASSSAHSQLMDALHTACMRLRSAYAGLGLDQAWPELLAAFEQLHSLPALGESDGLQLVQALAGLATLPAQAQPALLRARDVLMAQMPALLHTLLGKLQTAARRAQQLLLTHSSLQPGDAAEEDGASSQGSTLCSDARPAVQLAGTCAGGLAQLPDAAGQVLLLGQSASLQVEELVELLLQCAAQARLRQERQHLAAMQAASGHAALKAQLQMLLTASSQQLQVRPRSI
jgi:hypothetical protein